MTVPPATREATAQHVHVLMAPAMKEKAEMGNAKTTPAPLDGPASIATPAPLDLQVRIATAVKQALPAPTVMNVQAIIMG